MSKTYALLIVMLFALVLSGCGDEKDSSQKSTPRPTPAPDTEAGMGFELFNRHCDACHITQGSREMAGPSLDGIASRAGDRVDGMSAEEYLHQSIVEPDAHLVEGYEPGDMQQNFGELLSSDEIDHLVAYLMMLE